MEYSLSRIDWETVTYFSTFSGPAPLHPPPLPGPGRREKFECPEYLQIFRTMTLCSAALGHPSKNFDDKSTHSQ